MSIYNPCDADGCPSHATHVLSWPAPIGTDERPTSEFCDVHQKHARNLGARHERWIDEPAFVRRVVAA